MNFDGHVKWYGTNLNKALFSNLSRLCVVVIMEMRGFRDNTVLRSTLNLCLFKLYMFFVNVASVIANV